MSRKDVHELGEALDTGEALLIVVGRDKLEDALSKAGLKAQKQLEKQLDMKGKDLDQQLGEAGAQGLTQLAKARPGPQTSGHRPARCGASRQAAARFARRPTAQAASQAGSTPSSVLMTSRLRRSNSA